MKTTNLMWKVGRGWLEDLSKNSRKNCRVSFHNKNKKCPNIYQIRVFWAITLSPNAKKVTQNETNHPIMSHWTINCVSVAIFFCSTWCRIQIMASKGIEFHHSSWNKCVDISNFSWELGRGFESRHVYWMDIFSHIFVVKICNVCLKRPKINKKEVGQFKKKNLDNY